MFALIVCNTRFTEEGIEETYHSVYLAHNEEQIDEMIHFLKFQGIRVDEVVKVIE